ncbi:MAG TPA: AMP-binding protein [Phycisphaerae bacterium]|nr:AMP-binding protein [Phycisphaerae bacterium]
MVIESLLDAAGRFPAKTAVIDPFRRLSYAQLTTLAKVIRRIVLKETACRRVGILLPGSSAGMSTLLGVIWAGRTAIPLNFLLQARELTSIIEDADIDLVIGTRYFESILATLPIRTLYIEQLGLPRRYLWEKLRPTPEPPPVSPDDTAAIVYTSGSTGRPKGVCLSHANFENNVQAAIRHLQLDPENHLLGVLPPFHVFGLTILNLLPVMLRATVTFIPRFSAQAVYETIAANPDITLLLAVPSMYAAIGRLKSIDASRCRGIKIAVSGGEPLPRKIYDLMLERTGIRLMEGYGMTETSPVISCDLPSAHRVGSVGLPLPGVEVQIRNENGCSLPANQTGELYVRGPSVMKGYYNRPEETKAVIDKDGWLRTGDIVQIADDGHITITGRSKDIIIVGGENVYPREIEAVLEQHPAVQEAAVVGQTDEMRGEVVVAFVILNGCSQVTGAELRAFCRDHLAGFKVPREIFVRDSLPRTPSGKILKRQLMATLAGRRNDDA